MKKRLTTGLLLSLAITGGAAYATEGEELWQQLECKTCHDPLKNQVDIGLGPSLAQISSYYTDDEDALVTFLKGEGKPRIAPNNYMVMETQLAMILYGKPEENLRSLARFLLSHKAEGTAPPAAAPESAPQ